MSMAADHQHLSLSVDCIQIPEPSRSVGGGGYCDMFRGIYTPTGIHLALKRPRFSTQDPLEAADARRRFEREGRIWATLKHLNILSFFGMLDISGETYLISPWLEHGDLSRFVPARLRFLELSPDERARHPERVPFETFDEWDIIYGIVSGLAYLHENNVIHGDMKAANVLLDTEIRPVLCDFGMTKVLDGVYNATSTAMQGAGSFRWMSPEMLMNAPKSRESDIYAFGMTIVEVITGKVPFPDIISPGAIALAITSGQRPTFEPLSRDQTSFEDLWKLASSCWDHNPDKRPSANDSLTMMVTSTTHGRLRGLLNPPSHEALGLGSVVSTKRDKSPMGRPVSFERPKLAAQAMSRPSSVISYATAHSTMTKGQELSPTNIHTDPTSTGTSPRRSPVESYVTEGSTFVNDQIFNPVNGHNDERFRTVASTRSRSSSVASNVTEQSLADDLEHNLNDVQGNTLQTPTKNSTPQTSLFDMRSPSPSRSAVTKDDVFGDRTGNNLTLQKDISGNFYYAYTSGSDAMIPKRVSEAKDRSTTPPDLPETPVGRTSPSNSQTLEWLMGHPPTPSPSPIPDIEISSEIDFPTIPKEILPFLSPDILAPLPDQITYCSSCSVILDTFRYVCAICGPKKTMSRSEYSEWHAQLPQEHWNSRWDDPKGSEPAVSKLPSLSISPSQRILGGGPLSSSPLSMLSNLFKGKPKGVRTMSGEPAMRSSGAGDSPETGSQFSLPGAALAPVSSPKGALLISFSSPPQLQNHHHHALSLIRFTVFDQGFELCSDCIYTAGVSHAYEGALDLSQGPSYSHSESQHALSSPAETLVGTNNLGYHVSSSNIQGEVDLMLRRSMPAQKGRTRHAFVESMWDGSGGGWRAIEQEDKRTCSICGASPAAHQYKCVSCPQFDLCAGCYGQVHDIHPSHAFLEVSGKSASARPTSPILAENSGPEEQSLKHLDVSCYNCGLDIVGARFHCAVCKSVDVCQNCELAGLPGNLTNTDEGHDSSHIMIKVCACCACSLR
ncbi:hypothetical protein FRB93_005232 [Tulasnella sp. JGI-2019a]|nr:hypothetical protein FRB93_005232 [Tulasnella sp. JGI-2019a]